MGNRVKKNRTYKLLDTETIREIQQYVSEYIRTEQADSTDDNLLEFINSLLGNNDTAPPDYLRKTRRLLKSIRAGTASEDETAVVMRCVQQMNSRAQNPLEKRRLYALAMHYLAPKIMTVKQLANKLIIDKATVYRDINSTTERLAALIHRHYAL